MPRKFGKVDSSASWARCGQCGHKHEPGAQCPPAGVWAGSGLAGQPGVVWTVRPMPEGQWPADPRAPRDDSFSWWVHSACGHPGGNRQWAFYWEDDARQYETIFRDDPCRYTRCARRTMIENNRRR